MRPIRVADSGRRNVLPHQNGNTETPRHGRATATTNMRRKTRGEAEGDVTMEEEEEFKMKRDGGIV